MGQISWKPLRNCTGKHAYAGSHLKQASGQHLPLPQSHQRSTLVLWAPIRQEGAHGPLVTEDKSLTHTHRPAPLPAPQLHTPTATGGLCRRLRAGKVPAGEQGRTVHWKYALSLQAGKGPFLLQESGQAPALPLREANRSSDIVLVFSLSLLRMVLRAALLTSLSWGSWVKAR